MKIRIKRESVWSSVQRLDFCCYKISNNILDDGKISVAKSQIGSNKVGYDTVFDGITINYCPYCGAKIEELEEGK